MVTAFVADHPQVLRRRWLDSQDSTDLSPVLGQHPTAVELPGIEMALGGRQRLRLRDREQEARERRRVVRRLAAGDGDDERAPVAPRRLQTTRCAAIVRGIPQHTVTQRLEALRPIGEGRHPHLAIEPMRPADLADRDESAIQHGYSTISSTARFFSFVALALRIVRSARAVRPCLPMTLPRSFWATRSSITITRSPSTSVTLTCSGSSTSAFAT